MKVKAASLLHPRRLDIVLKARWFDALLKGQDGGREEELYRWHIARRTGGFEKDSVYGGPSTKRTVDDYVDAGRDLLASMRARGFDEAHPVPVSRDGVILAGAHRVAVALALGIDVEVEVHDKATLASPWGASWMRSKGLSKDDLVPLLDDYVRLVPDAVVFVLWGTVDNGRLMRLLAPEFQAVGVVDIKEAPETIAAIVQDVYALPGNADIPWLAGGLGGKVDRILAGSGVIRAVVARGDPKAARRVKERMRERAHPKVDRALYATCHASSSRPEALHLANLLLQRTAREHLRLRRSRLPSEEMLRWLATAHDTLRRLKIAPAVACVVGSGILDLLGIRKATDIDLTVTAAVRRRLFDRRARPIGDGVDLVTEGYHRTAGRRISDDVLIHNPEHHFWAFGLKFAALNIVAARKAFSARPKDLADIAALQEAGLIE